MRIRKRDERGFTVVELLIAIVIEAILVAGIGTALITTLNGGTSVDQSLDRTSDARTAANYVISDARNSSGPDGVSSGRETSSAPPSRVSSPP